MSDAVEANLALVRRVYELWNTSAEAPLEERGVAPDMTFHEFPEAPAAGVYRGAGVRA